MNSILKKLSISTLREFDGSTNYYNPTNNKKITLFRKEVINNNILVSNIVDEKDNIILESYSDDEYIYSFEDPRFISENIFTFVETKYTNNEYKLLCGCKMFQYDLTKKTKTELYYNFNFFEKNWQIINNKTYYTIEPLVIYKNQKIYIDSPPNSQWNKWIKKYGIPRMSTNVFYIDGIPHMLYHSNKCTNGIYLKYYSGLLILNKKLLPIGYYEQPLFPDVDSYRIDLKQEYFNWRRKLDCTLNLSDVIFPMSVIQNNNIIQIYCGINDCIAAIITIKEEDLKNNLNNKKIVAL